MTISKNLEPDKKLELESGLYTEAFNLLEDELIADINDTFTLSEFMKIIGAIKNRPNWKKQKIDLSIDKVRQLLIEDPKIKKFGKRDKSNRGDLYQIIFNDPRIIDKLRRKGFAPPLKGYFITRYAKKNIKLGKLPANYLLKYNHKALIELNKIIFDNIQENLKELIKMKPKINKSEDDDYIQLDPDALYCDILKLADHINSPNPNPDSNTYKKLMQKRDKIIKKARNELVRINKGIVIRLKPEVFERSFKPTFKTK